MKNIHLTPKKREVNLSWRKYIPNPNAFLQQPIFETKKVDWSLYTLVQISEKPNTWVYRLKTKIADNK